MQRVLGENADTLGTTEVDYVATCVEEEQFMLRSTLLKTAPETLQNASAAAACTSATTKIPIRES